MRSMSAQWQLPYFSLLFAHCKSIALEAQCDVLRKYKIFAMFIDAPLFCPSASKNCGEGNWDADAVSSRRFIRSQCLLRSHGSEWCWVNVRRVTSHNVAGIGWHRESRQSLMNFRFANDFLCQLPIKHRKKKDSRQGEKERERDTQKKQCKRRRPAAINELRETGQKTLNIA